MSEAAAPRGFVRQLSDDRLARRAVGGDQRAFAAIFRRYHQSLYRYCLAIVGNPEDAHDALQNTMMKVLRALPGEEREIELKPWLYRIAHNEAIDLIRRRRETRELDVEQVAPGYGLAEDAATRERMRRLLADVAELPERQRQVLVMRELSGLDFEEIGSALGTSGAVARQALYEARQSLHQMEAGHEMKCAAVTKALSDGDGRVLRRRDVSAHLRTCADCRRFREEIKSRKHQLAALSPLPAAAAAGMLHGLLSGGQNAAGSGLAATLGGGAAKSIGASAAAKGVATVAVVAAIGVSAADRSGVVHLGLPGDRAARSAGAGAGDAAGTSDGQGRAAVHSSSAASAGAAAAGPRGHDGAAEARGPGMTPVAGAQSRSRGHAATPAAEKAHGPQAHPHGRGHERQPSNAAGKGQEKAATHKSSMLPSPAKGGGGGSKGGGETKSESGKGPSPGAAAPDAPGPASPPPGGEDNGSANGKGNSAQVESSSLPLDAPPLGKIPKPAI